MARPLDNGANVVFLEVASPVEPDTADTPQLFTFV